MAACGFLSVDMSYRVYCLLMAPYSQNCQDPSLPTPSNFRYPGFSTGNGWYKSTMTGAGTATVLRPLTDTDLP